MRTLTVGQLKSGFSAVAKEVQKGEEIAISFGKGKRKFAVIIPYAKFAKRSKPRPLGLLKSKARLRIHKDFRITDEEFLRS
jgi:antitoxin (DNA-binding transcriptional repressor) of toxin-antitoxin stability system